MLYIIANRLEVEPGSVEPFSQQIDEIYSNPFKAKPSELTADDIKRQVIERLTGNTGVI